MTFALDSQIVKNYILLINSGLKTINDIPDIYNLREVIQIVLDS